VQFGQVLEQAEAGSLSYAICSPFDFSRYWRKRAARLCWSIINVDTVDGIQADMAGLEFLGERFHIYGIISHNPENAGIGKRARIRNYPAHIAVDPGLAMRYQCRKETIDLLDMPRPSVPYFTPNSPPFPSLIGSGLITTTAQIRRSFIGSTERGRHTQNSVLDHERCYSL